MADLNPGRVRYTVRAEREVVTKLLKVAVLGDYGVGKTCVVNRFIDNTFTPVHFATNDVSFKSKEVTVGGERYKLQIWDMSGQERHESNRASFYGGTDCLLLTFSVDDRDSFSNLVRWLDDYSKHATDSSFPCVIIGNKVDLAKREVPRRDAELWCYHNGRVPYFETSAKDATNVEPAFLTLIRLFRQKQETEPRRNDIVQLQPTTMVRKSCC